MTDTRRAAVSCRPALESDLPHIERLSDSVQALHARTRPDLFRTDVVQDGRRAFFQTALDDDDWQLWVACRGPHIVGYAMGELYEKQPGPIRHGYREAHIHQICVAEDERRCGIGRALLCCLLDALKSARPDRITVAYWTFNSGSQAFFTAQGFSPAMITSELRD